MVRPQPLYTAQRLSQYINKYWQLHKETCVSTQLLFFLFLLELAGDFAPLFNPCGITTICRLLLSCFYSIITDHVFISFDSFPNTFFK
ncbi:hypothetical protein L6452_26027 [Arctium lappa]|uniref:Uncharacterized protein n=1 Tax=Arctium lappa TaxID=4217 RepID=A0ACB9AC82_ARCLA|nr:hypothetical protein L6452_26027 [Arctium lappa]